MGNTTEEKVRDYVTVNCAKMTQWLCSNGTAVITFDSLLLLGTLMVGVGARLTIDQDIDQDKILTNNLLSQFLLIDTM